MTENILYLHSRCHLTEPTWTFIDYDTNEAVITCAACRKEITRLKLAEGQYGR